MINDFSGLFTVIQLGFLDKLFSALGAGDGDFAFSFGDPDRLAAAGAVEITVLPVLDSVQQHQKFPVFLVALIGIPGEAPEYGPEHEHIGNQGQHQIHNLRRIENRDNANDRACHQNHGIEFVRSVPSGHKPGQAHP